MRRRTRWRVAGVVEGMIEGGGRPSGYFTGATGVTIYRGDAYGPGFLGDAFIAVELESPTPKAHSVLTEQRDEASVQRVLSSFREKLL